MKLLLVLSLTYFVVGAMLAVALLTLPQYRRARAASLSPALFALFIFLAWLPLMLAPRIPIEQAEKIEEIVSR